MAPKTVMEKMVGMKISAIRPMTKAEAEYEGWELNHAPCIVIQLENGVKLYASQDYEGNGPGAMFGRTIHGDGFALG